MKNNSIVTKLIDWMDDKKLAIIAGIILFLSLIPVFYLASYARPSGDDYGYSVLTHAAWQDTHSLAAVFKAGIETVKGMYEAWNGDWFTVFLFSLMPEVFAPYTFFIVPYIMVGINVLGTAVFLYYIVVKIGRMSWEYVLLFASLILLVSYQFIPSTAIGMYWYVGATHYIVPHAVALLALVFGFRYYQTMKIRNIVYASLCMFMVGGSSYFSALLVFMVYAVMMLLFCRKRKDIFFLIIPFAIGAAGFIIQCLSPGNAARAGESFGFHLSDAFATVGQSLLLGISTIGIYFKEKTFIYVVLVCCAIFGWSALLKRKSEFAFRYPLLFVILMYGIYSAMYAPAVYAAVDVSKGPDTMVYFTFLLAAFIAILYVEGWMIAQLQKKEKKGKWNHIFLSADEYRRKIAMPLLLLCMIITALNPGWFADSVDKQVYDYVSSGQAEDFREQIQSQMEILLDDSVKEAYLVPINDDQGPLMHMPVTADEEAFTNRVVRDFYRKEKVVMISGD